MWKMEIRSKNPVKEKLAAPPRGRTMRPLGMYTGVQSHGGRMKQCTNASICFPFSFDIIWFSNSNTQNSSPKPKFWGTNLTISTLIQDFDAMNEAPKKFLHLRNKSVYIKIVKLFNTITKTLHHRKPSSFARLPQDTPEPIPRFSKFQWGITVDQIGSKHTL